MIEASIVVTQRTNIMLQLVDFAAGWESEPFIGLIVGYPAFEGVET
jgi:hypothetical protein